jgi:hypothetical protein
VRATVREVEPDSPGPSPPPGSFASVELVPVIISVDGTTPKLLTVQGAAGEALPAGYLDDAADRTLEQAVRRRVSSELGLPVRYFEQLYTFGNRARVPGGVRALAVAYLALARHQPVRGAAGARWRSCYELFPWEDWRSGRPAVLDDVVVPAVERWVRHSPAGSLSVRTERAELTFGTGGARWDPVRVLDRYELAYELGLVAEAARDAAGAGAALGPGGQTSLRGDGGHPAADAQPAPVDRMGVPLAFDHRRVAAAALERLRGKLAYRPVVFEVLPEAFTLSTLQQVVEAFAGQHLHKQNFRRLVAAANLVEPTGQSEPATGGRPAELYRFRREVLRERPAPGLGLRRLGGI